MFTSFHLVLFSPWPILVAFSVWGMIVSGLLYMHFKFIGMLLLNVAILFVVLFLWFGDVEVESWLGYHSRVVVSGLRLGVVLFIVSEVFFFFGFFWSFFHNCLTPSFVVNTWPPYGFSGVLVDPYGFPLFNTILLLSSGVSITLSHHCLLVRSYSVSLASLLITLLFGFLFLGVQFEEYSLSDFSVNSSVYGTVFYLLTGFHGFHVIVGFCMISFVGIRYLGSICLSDSQHVGFEAAAWYWHFVDVVWIFLYIFIYWYGYIV
uniref:Cytochrome c oxidase subunit 3 n=1 Tax=Diversibipalium mayottensis TaxID=3348909 RepID=A0A8K1X786_9PLAT|nr:cytochrome c oxidase subunit 3 [Diversibipalium sp. MNHN JL281]